MPHVVLSLNYINRVKQFLQGIQQEVRGLELVEYDLGKASILERQIQRLESVVQGLQDITNNSQKYLVI
jgi:hypothetical protein